jgi:hydroxymethylbilane synthase
VFGITIGVSGAYKVTKEPMKLLEQVNHENTTRHITAERTMPHMLRGHCNSPIAGHCHTGPDGKLSLFGAVK